MPEIERQVLKLRQAHMRWGRRKLKRILERDVRSPAEVYEPSARKFPEQVREPE